MERFALKELATILIEHYPQILRIDLLSNRAYVAPVNLIGWSHEPAHCILPVQPFRECAHVYVNGDVTRNFLTRKVALEDRFR